MAEAGGNRTHRPDLLDLGPTDLKSAEDTSPRSLPTLILGAARGAVKAASVAFVLVLSVACGVKKDPVPPLRRVPHPAEFTLAQQGP